MAKINKRLRIKTRDGTIQDISLYSEKADVLKNGVINCLVIRNGGWGGYAALGDLNYPKASKMKYGNKVVLTEALAKRIIDLSDKYKILELYPRDFTTMKHIPDEKNIEFITGKRTSLENMFHLCKKLISAPLFDTSKVINMKRMFSFCDNLISIPLFNTSSVINMDGMFTDCRNLISVPLLNTPKVTNMYNMFVNCYKLNSVPLFNTFSVTNMNCMFAECHSLTSVPPFNTSNVINMEAMFAHCYNLTSIPIFDIRNVKNIDYMLQDNNVNSVTFRNKPANLQINSQILCGDPNRIKTIKFI